MACATAGKADSACIGQAVSTYPRGVSYVPTANPAKPFQARVWWGGRRWSLGYYRSITEAELAVSRCYREAAEWEEMQLPPPTLRLVQERRGRRATSPRPADLPDEMPVVDPLLCPQQSGSPASPQA